MQLIVNRKAANAEWEEIEWYKVHVVQIETISRYGKGHRIFNKVLFARVTSSHRTRTLTTTPCNSNANLLVPRNDLRNALDTLNSGVRWQLVCRVSTDQLVLRNWLVKIYIGKPRERYSEYQGIRKFSLRKIN